MKDTSMIRISTSLRDSLKVYADIEGRRMEWVADRAIEQYLNSMTNQQAGAPTIQKKEPNDITYAPPQW